MSAAHDLALAKKAACELVTELDMLIVAMRFGQVVKLHELEHFYRAANFIATHVIVGEKKGEDEPDRRAPPRLIDTLTIGKPDAGAAEFVLELREDFAAKGVSQ